MQLETTLERIKGALSRLNKIPSKQNQLPVLGCILFEAANGILKLRVTNLDVGAEINLPAKLIKEGVVAVPESILLPYVSSLPAGGQKLVCEVVGGGFQISCGDKKAVIKILSHEEFPAIPQVKEGAKIKIGSAEMISGLRSVLYCVSMTSHKPELSGVLIQTDADGTTFAATDAFRLAEKKFKGHKAGQIDHQRVLIPYKNAHDLIRVFDGVDAELGLVVGEHQMSVVSDDIFFTTRLIDAVFPDYTKLFPDDSKSEATLLRSDLVQAMKSAQIFSDKLCQILLRVVPRDGVLEISSKGSDAGDHSERIVAAMGGDTVEMRFNWRYVLDCLNNLTTDSVNLRFHGPGRPITIKGVSDPSFIYLLMPMNVSS